MTETTTTGAALLRRLHALGVEVVFCNSGSDFPPIIEGLAEANATGRPVPRMLNIPHEHVAMGMAHGYHARSGKTPGLLLHTNVGLSNAATGAINAAMAHVPMLMMSGRTPTTEQGRFGARTVPIAWGQEMRDQAALVREASKWEYELRFPEQVAEVLDRALAIATSTPKGPAYLALPREVLCEAVEIGGLDRPPSIAPARVMPDGASLARAAATLAGAKAPLIIAQRGAGDAASFALFEQMARDRAIPVCSWWAVEMAIDTDHPCHIGPDPSPWIDEADVILVLDCLAPWSPDIHKPRADAVVINAGPNPIYSRFPIRNFRSDITLAGENADLIPALAGAMAALPRDEAVIAERRTRVAAASEATRERTRATAAAGDGAPMSRTFVSQCVGEALEGVNSTVFTELGTMLGHLARRGHGSFFQEPHSGGLGWSLPAAMGALIADPGRVAVATMGDGSYMFANPTVCHQVAEALGLPVVAVVLNNHEYGAVRNAVKGMYPDGHAARANEMPLTSLGPSPDFTLSAAASRAHVERVERGADLPGALARAIGAATEERRQALVEVRIAPG